MLQELTCRGEFSGNTPEYKLLKNFGDVWSMDHNNSEESLFEVQTNNDISYNLGERISVVCGSRNDGGWAWGLPTSHLEKAFKDAGDDERRKWTIIKHGEAVQGDPDVTSYTVKPEEHKSPRVTRKLYIPVSKRPKPYDAPHIPLNYRLLRYADVLLMYAEVENALGNDGEARWALNEVRRRVDLSEVTASGTALRDAIRLERRLELALENNRLFDLRRWKEAENVLNGDFYGMNFSGKDNSSFYVRTPYLKRVYKKAYYWFPIHQSEIDKNDKLVQSPYWN